MLKVAAKFRRNFSINLKGRPAEIIMRRKSRGNPDKYAFPSAASTIFPRRSTSMPPRRNEQVPPGEMYSSVRTDSLAPRPLFLCAFLTSFVLPNLIFSGEYFFSTLHLMKWAATLAPLAILGAAAGFRVLRFGTERTGFRLDGFAVIWLALLLYVTVQPFWAPPRSTVTFFQEWFFFGSLWLAYTLASLLADGKVVRALLWGALLNAAASVLFAELQIRGLNGPYPFILPTPGNYTANTGQQNMFALWMARLLYTSPSPRDQRGDRIPPYA